MSEERLILVDDDPAVRRVYERVLSRLGWQVALADGGESALAKLRERPCAVILSDLAMPGMDGLEFLRAVRELDLDVPVVLMTGQPGLDSAMRAVEYGAFSYLVKPLDHQLLDDTLRRAARLHALARLKREALEAGSRHGLVGDRAGLEARFAMALEHLWMAYQPIVEWRERRVFGYEALVRSDEPTLALPDDLIAAAERLHRVHDMGRSCRALVAAEADHTPDGARLFVNLHAQDLEDEHLYNGEGLAGRQVVLEITERAPLDGIKGIAGRIGRLRALGFMVALDDLGAGYAGLQSFSQLAPDVAKLDMSLVRDIEAHPRRQVIARSMKRLCDELGVMVVAEGVETVAERDTLADLGFNLLQGYLFARPAKGFPAPCF